MVMFEKPTKPAFAKDLDKEIDKEPQKGRALVVKVKP